MNTRIRKIVAGLLFLTSLPTFSQAFNTGSTGELGDMSIDRPTTLDLPPDGVFNVKSLKIGKDGVLTFRQNALNTPVMILSQGDIIINGKIDISGTRGTGTSGGIGGPGGFAGGAPGFGDTDPGAGYGPGGGLGGTRDDTATTAGAAGFHDAAVGHSAGRGQPYGNSLLIPLIGGSGGGGLAYYGDWGTGYGGGGGGGALLLASNTRIHCQQVEGGDPVRIRAVGGEGTGVNNAGSGGALRLVAPVVSGNVEVNVLGGSWASAGRVRIDANDVSGLIRNVSPNHALSIGSVMVARLTPEPKIEITEVAGTVIPENSTAPVQVILPSGSSPNQNVSIQLRNFSAKVPIEVVLIPDSGAPVVASATIDNSTANPAKLSIPIVFPINVGVTVQAWVRGKP